MCGRWGYIHHEHYVPVMEQVDIPDVINGPLLGERVRHPPARVARADQIGSSVASRCPPGRAGSIPARHNPKVYYRFNDNHGLVVYN